MNLLDQLELFTLEAGRGRVTQRDFWVFVDKCMKSGNLLTREMESHLREKLRGLGVESS